MSKPASKIKAKTHILQPGAPVNRGKGEVRIIGGQWRRSLLPVSQAPGLRPTPDRVRETLFNWLGQDLTGWNCADLFAGSGALGFEAASRGAKRVLMVEQCDSLARQLQQVQQRLQASTVSVERGDGVSALRREPDASLDLILIDPPFDSDAYLSLLALASRAIAADGFIYLEAPRAWIDQDLAPFSLRVYRYLKASAVHAHLLQRTA